ncbi:MAG: GNAT family N-acetyltransferase [Candidatus Thermoplasmatota archaeon]|nr:GNAT family N-acetyltransferase [Candidatus Thermoplasmatota archaeon]
MQVRFATNKDAKSIIEHNMLLATESENESLHLATVEQGVKTLLSHSEKGFYLVAEENKKVIGQLMITFEWSDWRNTSIWWIQSVYVHKDYRKKGVFSSLFNEVKRLAKEQDIPLLRLYVHKDNASAHHVYEKQNMTAGLYRFYEIAVERAY